MILSGTRHHDLGLDPTSHAASTADLRSRLDALEERRLAAEDAVTRVLGSWRGDAADTFARRWDEWDRGARAVIDQLTAGVSALDAVRVDLLDVDAARGAGATLLQGRLG